MKKVIIFSKVISAVDTVFSCETVIHCKVHKLLRSGEFPITLISSVLVVVGHVFGQAGKCLD